MRNQLPANLIVTGIFLSEKYQTKHVLTVRYLQYMLRRYEK